MIRVRRSIHGRRRLPEIIHGYDKDDVWNMDGLKNVYPRYTNVALLLML